MNGRIQAMQLRRELSDPMDLAKRLDLLDGLQRQAGGVLVRCPWHEDRTPSCSIRRGNDGTISVRCHGCDQTGDALSLIAVVSGLDVRKDFGEVMKIAAKFAGRHDYPDHAFVPRPKPSPAPIPERTYPPANEVTALIDACAYVFDDLQAMSMLATRGIDGGRIDRDVAVALPTNVELPRWASYRGKPWTETGHRLLFPMVDHAGEIRSVRAWRIVDGDSPKRLPPAGHRAAGLVLADEFAVAMLRGTYAPRVVVILEGEPDWLTWVMMRGSVLAARIGIAGSGSWSQEIAARIPTGTRVVIRTDDDGAGNKYATQIARDLRGRCELVRPRKELEAAG